MWHDSLGLSLDALDLASYDKQTVARHQELILQYMGFRTFDAAAQTLLTQEIAGMVRAQLKPRLIFWRCVDLLLREKVAMPTYFRLAALILTLINRQKQTLTALLDSHAVAADPPAVGRALRAESHAGWRTSGLANGHL